MKVKTSIRLKAGLLLVLFSLNTLIGFTCATVVDMNFNHSHHHDEATEKPVTHIPADGKKHEHRVKANHLENNTPKKEKDNCCSDEVVKFSNTEKSLVHPVVINPKFLPATPPSYYAAAILFSSHVAAITTYNIESYHPPIPNIRIAIQPLQVCSTV